MDATKIGRFIGAERRAKGWTQRQLADKLQLTDKAAMNRRHHRHSFHHPVQVPSIWTALPRMEQPISVSN